MTGISGVHAAFNLKAK